MSVVGNLVGVGVIDKYVYAIGGIHHTGIGNLQMFHGCCEVYDTSTNEWSFIARMPTPRFAVGVAVLNGELYAVGGQKSSTSALKTVERYSPDQNRWSSVAPMSAHRSQPGTAVLDGKLYVVGGDACCLNHALKSAEYYDVQTDRWTSLPDMNTPRSGAGVVAHDGKLYVVGGKSDDMMQPLSSIEVYNPKSNTWSYLPSEMSEAKHSFGVALINKPGLSYHQR